ncbi:MAG: ATP-dependent DNA helicase UvrD2 [Actinomycetota bacterium]|nr:ATP-dependent DNA helicase UvrD2 [Actinomycetota bacterium]
MRDAIFEGLNPQQLRAVEAVTGPVCILAGAGSGKTATITRRIAHQVRTGTFEADAIFAVTFTRKAGEEMSKRLQALGAHGVRASTFHAAAYRQLNYFAPERSGQTLTSKLSVIAPMVRSLPAPFKFRSPSDVATEIERAKRRRLTPTTYLDNLHGTEPPIPAERMHEIFVAYERTKDARGMLDFEDMMIRAIELFRDDPRARNVFRARYQSFTVDEYQDVSPLQQDLLDAWLGDSHELCAVGDDYQAIYGFNGATPRFLLELERKLPGVVTVRLEHNYRSSPQVLELANRLVPKLEGAEKVLRPTLPDGPPPGFARYASVQAEGDDIVRHIRALAAEGVPLSQIAILYRVNSQSQDYEQALARGAVAFRVAEGSFLQRPAATKLLPRVRRSRSVEVSSAITEAAVQQGWSTDAGSGGGAKEQTRQKDLGLLVSLADAFDDGLRTVADFVADLEARFRSDAEDDAVNLMTYHSAKGLEFEAVLLPRLEEGLLPYKRSMDGEDLEEERRLLYVGMTRAKRYLHLSCVDGGRGKPSRFLEELGLVTKQAAPRAPADGGGTRAVEDEALFTALKAWRLERSRADEVPAYVVLHDSVLEDLCRSRPADARGLGGIPGFGPVKLERYGSDVLAVIARHPRPQPDQGPSIPARPGLEVELRGGISGIVHSVTDTAAIVLSDGGAELTVDLGDTVRVEGRSVVLVAPEPAPTEA